MTREELISYLEYLMTQRAFSYEDRMKLAILDESPFTIWASDRNCKIRLWEGKCEALYGYSKTQAIGKDYVDLFVSEDEQVAARKDQLSIIDENAVFHNIANDKGKHGNTLRLITNCFRIKDPISNEYWNAEMGLIIDYLEQEKKRLEHTITESQLIKSCVSQFIEITKQYKEHFQNRKKSISTAIRTTEKAAVSMRRRNEFKERINPIQELLKKIEESLESLIIEYCSKMKSCDSYEKCENVRREFVDNYNNTLDNFEDIIVDIEEISTLFNSDTSIVQFQDAIIKEAGIKNSELTNKFHELYRKVESEIADYKSLNADPSSERFVIWKEMQDSLEEYKRQIINFTSSICTDVLSAKTEQQLTIVQQRMEVEYEEIEISFKKIEQNLKGE